MNGLDVAVTVRRHHASIPIALVTGSIHMIEPDRDFKCGDQSAHDLDVVEAI